jgi:hypothetical protein
VQTEKKAGPLQQFVGESLEEEEEEEEEKKTRHDHQGMHQRCTYQ